jgi:hypothetical protein
MTEDPLHRATRWKAFYEEAGGLDDVLSALRRAYFERAQSLGAKDTDGLLKLSIADKIAAELDAHIRYIIDGGKIEQDRKAHVERVRKVGKFF